jgi:hypothetical protein
MVVTFNTYSHGKFHSIICGVLLHIVVKIKAAATTFIFILYKYNKGTLLSEDNKGVDPELGEASVDNVGDNIVR